VNTTSARENQEKIVVGVDGSGHSGQALNWAAREAKLRSASLEVIYVFPALVSLVGSTAHEYYPEVEQEAAQVLDRALADAPVDPSVPMERVLVPGSPAKVLVEASDNASMLVVGSRGLGEFRGMLLGSVSIHCVQQARCPVVVVRSGSREAALT
jgi:nucleotide-binding universal stress UspA family protein